MKLDRSVKNNEFWNLMHAFKVLVAFLKNLCTLTQVTVVFRDGTSHSWWFEVVTCWFPQTAAASLKKNMDAMQLICTS